MRQTTVCFLLRYGPHLEVLLGYKKTGFGAGKYAGIGGKVEENETVVAATIREVSEEIGLLIPRDKLQPMGSVIFQFPWMEAWSQEMSILVATAWQGEPGEGDEMKPFWFRPQDIPYDSMWQDARYWLPSILLEKPVHMKIMFREDNESVSDIIRLS